MTKKEMLNKINAIYDELLEDYEEWEIGLRFEDMERKVGDNVAPSKHNAEREDERDFPEYGTEEYEEMDDLPGTSAWSVEDSKNSFYGMFGEDDDEAMSGVPCNHDDLLLGDGEILIADARVYAVIV